MGSAMVTHFVEEEQETTRERVILKGVWKDGIPWSEIKAFISRRLAAFFCLQEMDWEEDHRHRIQDDLLLTVLLVSSCSHRSFRLI